ncbi:MAG: STAS domain-containing protein [Verrucomicrobiota bacterium]
MTDSSILIAQESESAFVKVIGKGSFKNAKLLKDFSETVRKEGITRFILDLQLCKHMDSTFMGVLAGLASEQKKHEGDPPKVVHLSGRNRELLETLGLDKVLTLGDDSEEGSDKDYEQLKTLNEESKEEAAKTMLEAHENLIEADQRNATKFQDVVKFLRHKLDSQ